MPIFEIVRDDLKVPVKVEADSQEEAAAFVGEQLKAGSDVVLPDPLFNSPQDFNKIRQEAAIQEPAFQALQGAIIPTLGAVASAPLGFLGQAAVGAGAELLNQKLGLAPESKAQVALAGGVPLIAGGLAKSVKTLTKAGAELAAPGALREAAAEATAERFGQLPETLKRIYTKLPSARLFNEARAQGPVPTQSILNTIGKALQAEKIKSTPNSTTVRRLENLLNKYQQGPEASYDDLITEMQELRLYATGALERRNPAAAKSLLDARSQILDEMSKISPVIKEANRTYARESLVQDTINVMRGPNPASKLRTLIETDSVYKNLFTRDELKDVVYLADQISDVASSAPAGFGRQLLSAMTEPVSQLILTRPGRAILRQVIKPQKKLTVVGVATALQFMRAYIASKSAQGLNVE